MSVPDTNTFNLQNVVDEVNPTTDDLVDCFADAIDGKFDSDYGGSGYVGTGTGTDRQSNFRNYNFGSDWFLPSRDELNAMYVNLYLEEVGDFTSQYYWCSTETNDTDAYEQRFLDGSQSADKKCWGYYVRACRSFTAGIGDYDIRDTGPAGGLIFYVDGGTTYYEAAPSDQSSNQVWSNIDDELAGVEDEVVGTGQANTTTIIGQDGHTTSAAKLCDDLSV